MSHKYKANMLKAEVGEQRVLRNKDGSEDHRTLRKDGEWVYTRQQVREMFEEVRHKLPRLLQHCIDEPLIFSILLSYIGEEFCFPPDIFETSFHGNGWICLTPGLKRGQVHAVAAQSPTGIQVEWSFHSGIRFEVSCEWDVKRVNFKFSYTFFRTRKKSNGTVEHTFSDKVKIKTHSREQPFSEVLGVEVDLRNMGVPALKVFFDGKEFTRYKIPIRRKEFLSFGLNEQAFKECRDVNFYLGAKIRHIKPFWYA